MSRKYANPPIVEALCEFRFIPSQPWDMTIPGLLYGKIKSEFRVKKQLMDYGIKFQPKKESVKQQFELSRRMQFIRSDNSALIQVGPNLLTINHLKPYPSWDNFKPLIVKNLEKYKDIAKPKAFERIGLRYINKIEFDKSPKELSNYFNYYPFIPKGLPQDLDAFNVRVEIPYEDERDRLLLNLASSIPEKPNVISLLLDFDYIMAIPERISLDQASDWIEKAHTTLESAFEACITDRCRKLFREKK